MPFNQKPQKFNAKINAVTVGTGDKAVTIGGNSTFPFYTFDAPTENSPKIGVEITDMGLDDFAPGIKAYYEGCTTMAEIAQKAAAMEGGDFVVLNLQDTCRLFLLNASSAPRLNTPITINDYLQT